MAFRRSGVRTPSAPPSLQNSFKRTHGDVVASSCQLMIQEKLPIGGVQTNNSLSQLGEQDFSSLPQDPEHRPAFPPCLKPAAHAYRPPYKNHIHVAGF